MNSSFLFHELDETLEILSKNDINVMITFLVGDNTGYGESIDNYTKSNKNQIFITSGPDNELFKILSQKELNIEIPDDIALQIIETFHHEVEHILHRLIEIKKENSLDAEIIALEYLLSQNSRWYRKNYLDTFMERNCEFNGYGRTILFINGLDVSQERKEELYKTLCENFEKAYKKIIPKKERVLQGETYETKALSMAKLLRNRSLEIINTERGIFNVVESKSPSS
jgi:hypothetical protein